MPDSRVSLLRVSCESLLAQLIQTPIITSLQPFNNAAEDGRPEVESLIALIRRSFTEPAAKQGLQPEALKAARQLGECYAEADAEVHGLISQLLEACQQSGSMDQGSQQKQTELLACAVEAYVSERTRHLAEQAQRDPLTRLFNRAVFEQRSRDELARAQRYGRALSLVLFDVDQLKLINDRLGHPAGDEVLQQFANLLQSALRQSDLAFRYGGDEFAALLPETDSAAAGQVLQRLQERLHHSLRVARLPEPVGISYGSASFPADANSALALLKVADARLYEDKRANQAKHS
jgi:diguanylate cyclase (GGDEF)-like protein